MTVAQRAAIVLAAMALGALCGIAFLFLAAPEWESSVTLRVGKVANKLIDNPRTVAEQLSGDAFKEEVRKSLKFGPLEEDRRSRLLRSSLRARNVGGTDVVRIRLRGYSPADAQAALQAVLDRVVAQHAAASTPLLSSLQDANAQITKLIESAEGLQEKALAAAQARRPAAGASGPQSGDVLTTGLMASIDLWLRQLVVMRLHELLSPIGNNPSAAVEPIYVSAEPVHPSALTALLTALAISGLLGVLVVALRERFLQRHTMRP